jgi:hypothetical protein
MGAIKDAQPIDPAALNPDWDQYYSALGRFMHEFGVTEDEINRVIQDFVIFDQLRLPVEKQLVAYAVLGSQRIATARDTLKRLLRVANAGDEVRVEIDRVLSQLGEIQFFRDRIAHAGAFPDISAAGRFVMTNQAAARETDQIEWISFTPQMLLDMAADLERMPYLIQMGLASPEERNRHAGMAETAEDRLAVLDPPSRPWRYKPAQLVRTGPKYEPTPPRRDRPPRSSQG